MTIVTSYRGELLFEARMGKHTLTIDAPTQAGGLNRNPTPIELWLSAVSVSIGQSVLTYCQNRGLDSNFLRVEMSYEITPDSGEIEYLNVWLKLPQTECDHYSKTALNHVILNSLKPILIIDDKRVNVQVIGKKVGYSRLETHEHPEIFH